MKDNKDKIQEEQIEELRESTKKAPKSENLQAKIDELTEEIEALKAEIAEKDDKYLRMAAEYDNFRKRTVKERDGLYAEAYSDAVKQLLPVIDNIERSVTFVSDEETRKGLNMIITQMTEALNKMGVTVIETKEFDPNVHNAVMHVDDEAYGEGEIVEVFQKGYKYKDKIIRYAMVKVAN